MLPFVGVIIGAWNWLIFTLVALVMPLPVAIIAGLFAEVIITGGFHVDALADTADGLFSSRKRERMLEIMKDSRVGANGVIAICFYFLFMALYSYPLLIRNKFVGYFSSYQLLLKV